MDCRSHAAIHLQHFSKALCHIPPYQMVDRGLLFYKCELRLLHACRYLLFLFSSVLLLGLRESRRRAEAGKPHTLTPPLMVRLCRWCSVPCDEC